ncbi:MAG: Gfo/Idh/MocA family oxidoreductase [Phycisphaeraceae bacterium]|nr:Gfo/Idh/MocA family oxidoreductase [Phycisphaeraceae bacterium]
MDQDQKKSGASRRDFLGGTVAGAAALAAIAPSAYAQASGTLKLGLIGCGGRGTGAMSQALGADKETQLWALADAFEDKVVDRAKIFAKRKHEVPKDRQFHGFDAYKKLIDSGVDAVVIATPPGFRPIHFTYAVQQGKHVFMEKPICVDGRGARMILDAAKKADDKGLKVGVGLQRHHSVQYQETVKRIQDGEIGDVVALRAYWNGKTPWVRGRQAGQTEMQYQMRNWYFFNWLCGDHITEQHIHNLDVCNWVMDDYPAFAQGMGGRQVRTGKDHGQIFDHHAVEFVYSSKGWDSKDARFDDAAAPHMFSQCRHMHGCWRSVSEHVHGSKGYASVNSFRLYDEKGNQKWRWKPADRRNRPKNPYVQEHIDLFQAIRKGEKYNEAYNGAMSSMTSVLGRMCTYSGKLIRMTDALNSKIDVFPYDRVNELDMNAKPPVVPDKNGRYPIPVPGKTEVV